MKFLENVFSIKNDESNTHTIVTIAGLKIKLAPIFRDEISYISAREIYSALEVSKQHTKVFTKYKNFHHDNVISIVGCGPTVKYYNNEIGSDIKIALNDAIFFNRFKFDYLFNWDIGVLKNNKNWYKDVKKYNCAKFYGHCLNEGRPSPFEKFDDEENHISHFYYSARHGWSAFNFGEVIHRDLTTYPLMDFGSIAFGALHFALYTRPQKIYLIGLDTSSIGHILGKNYGGKYETERMLRGYNKFKQFINLHYSDVEVISVNPVGLKGLFKDVYTKSYVDAHSKLLNEQIEIIEDEVINAN